MRLPVVVRGSGPRMVLLHGRASNSGTWEPLVPYLEGYELHLVDTIGHGAAPSPEDPAAYAIERHLDSLEETLASLDRPFVLVGHSMGGFLALRFALRHPGRVRALVLESASADNPFRGGRHAKAADALRGQIDLVRAEGMQALCEHLEAHDQLHPRQRQNLLAMSPVAYVETIRALAEMSEVGHRLGELRVPTLVVCGYGDHIFLPECRTLAERIPGARGSFLPDAAHSPHREDPAGMARALLAFLRELAPPGEPTGRARG